MRDSDLPTPNETFAASAAKAICAAESAYKVESMSTADALNRLGVWRDPEAWSVLIERHGNAILRVAQRASRDPVLCEDICQETLLQIREHANSFRALGAPNESELFSQVWIMRIACRTAFKMIRSRARRYEYEARAESVVLQSPCPVQSVLRDEECAYVRRELAALPEANRDAISLRFFANLTYAEIAKSFQISEDAAKKRVQRGIDQLRARLALGGVGISAALVSSVLGGVVETPAVLGRGLATTTVFLMDGGRRAAWQALVNVGRTPALTEVVSTAVVSGGLAMMGKMSACVAAVLVAALCIGSMELRQSRQLASNALDVAKESDSRVRSLEAKIVNAKMKTAQADPIIVAPYSIHKVSIVKAAPPRGESSETLHLDLELEPVEIGPKTPQPKRELHYNIEF